MGATVGLQSGQICLFGTQQFDHTDFSFSYEIDKQLPECDVVLVSVGGGGGISGIAAFFKNKNPKVQV